MSAIAEPPVSAPTVAPVVPVAPAALPTRRSPADNLPSGVKIDNRHDASEFFEKHQAAIKGSVVQPVAPVEPAAIAPVVPEKPTEIPPAKSDDVASQLTDQFLPDSAKPKPIEKPAEVPAVTDNPEDKVVLGKEYSPKAHESFNQIKTITKGLRDQLLAREREVVEARAETEKIKSGAVVVDGPEVQKLKAEHEVMSKRLLVMDLESHPNFQREFTGPKNEAKQEASNILEAAGVSGVDIESVLNKDPVSFRKALSELAVKLPTALDQADFATQMRTAHNLTIRAKDAVGKAAEINSALKGQAINGYKTAFEETYNSTIGALKIKELATPAGATTEQAAEVESVNQAIRSIRGNAEKIALGTSDPKAIAAAAIKAAAYEFHVGKVMPIMSKVISQRDARIAELEGELKGIRARNPNRDLGGIPHSGGGVDPSKMSHHEAAEYYANLGKGGG